MDSKMKVENLDLYYGKFKALKNINLDLPKNEITAFIGPSGCGKSTLLKSLNRMNDLVEGFKITGKVTLDGDDIYGDMDVNLLRKRVGMVFQHFNLFNNKTVLENIMLAPEYVRCKEAKKLKTGKSKKQIHEEVKNEAMELLKRIGLESKADVYPSKLSGGQKQRVAIARALALKPKILFFDEPTSALDPELTSEILKVIKDLAAEHITMVIVTHEMTFARDISDHIIFMDKGLIAVEGSPKEVFESEHARMKEFLGKFHQG